MNASLTPRAAIVLALLSFGATGCIFLSEDAPPTARPEEMTPDVDIAPDLDQPPPLSCAPACEAWQVCANVEEGALCVTNPTLASMLQWQDQAPITGRRRQAVSASISATSPDGESLRYALLPGSCPFNVTLTDTGALSFTCPDDWAQTCQVSVTATWRDEVTITAQRELTCVNATPRVSEVMLDPIIRSPDEPTGPVTCTFKFEDDDITDDRLSEIEDQSQIAWFSHGQKLGEGPVLDAPPKGEPVLCRVTPFDGISEGEPMLSAPLLVQGAMVATGDEHTCAIAAGGRQNLYCWGRNTSGQLGTRDAFGTNDVQGRSPVQAALTRPLTALSAGGAQTCVVSAGAVWCWGLSQPLSPDVPMPTADYAAKRQAGLEDGVTSLAVGRSHACAARMGALYCWGDNSYGQLGLPINQPSQPTPTLVPMLSDGVRAVAVGDTHTCAIRRHLQQDRLYCWGNNLDGQLGMMVSSPDKKLALPTELGTLGGPALELAAGAHHTCVIAQLSGQKTLLCWGRNDNGQLGTINDQLLSHQHRFVMLTGRPSAVSAGQAHTCALVPDTPDSANGLLWCWGDNNRGQLAQLAPANVEQAAGLPPTLVDTSTFYLSSAGARHTCAVYGMRASQLKCWGDNQAGQLGRPRSDEPQPTPADIELP